MERKQLNTMANFLREFNTHAEYAAFTESEEFVTPNVSTCKDENKVHYNPSVDSRLVVTYNVEDASQPTPLYFYNIEAQAIGVDMFDKAEIDGTEVSVADLDANNGSYQLSVGEHTVAYTLKDPTIIGAVQIDESTFKFGATFVECTAITNVIIPDSVTTIGITPFNVCTSLTNVAIPNSVTSIGTGAFNGCSSLTNVTIPNNVTSIGTSAFNGCSSLTNVTIPNNVTSIDISAFEDCRNLTSVTIGSSVTSIAKSAFYNCTNIANVTSNATTAPTIESNTFRNVKANGTLYIPSSSSGYDVWMGTSEYYLGFYNWTKVEQ